MKHEMFKQGSSFLNMFGQAVACVECVDLRNLCILRQLDMDMSNHDVSFHCEESFTPDFSIKNKVPRFLFFFGQTVEPGKSNITNVSCQGIVALLDEGSLDVRHSIWR